MSEKLRIRAIMLESGERMPILLDSRGIPLFLPTLFVATKVRSRNRASNTIDQVLRSVMVLYRHCHAVGIDIESRVRSGQMLAIHEIDRLAAAARVQLSPLNFASPSTKIGRRLKVIPVEKARARMGISGQRWWRAALRRTDFSISVVILIGCRFFGWRLYCMAATLGETIKSRVPCLST